MMTKKVIALQSLSEFWAELAVYGCAEKWAGSYSTENFDNGF